jgi:hypothetical protein
MKLSEEIKNNLINYYMINNERKKLLLELEQQFQPILDEAVKKKDVMTILHINHTFPKSYFNNKAMLEVQKITNSFSPNSS